MSEVAQLVRKLSEAQRRAVVKHQARSNATLPALIRLGLARDIGRGAYEFGLTELGERVRQRIMEQ